MLSRIMKKSFYYSFLMSIMLAHSSLAYADDTEIFFNVPASSPKGKANILFMLDLSQSMDGDHYDSAFDNGSEDRLTRMQGALKKVLSDEGFNVKAGMGAFTVDSASILYPVKDLNDRAEVEKIEGKIINGQDDGQVVLSSSGTDPAVGKHFFDSSELILSQNTIFHGGVENADCKPATSENIKEKIFTLASPLDDVLEINDFFNDTRPSYSEKSFGYYGLGEMILGEDYYETKVGLRFTDLTLPSWECLRSAKIKTISANDLSSNSKLKIRIENVANSAPFAAESRNSSGGSLTNRMLSNRSLHSKTIRWNYRKSQDKGEAEWTPELKPLFNKVTKKRNWANGNAALFVIDIDDDRYTYTDDPRQIYDTSTLDAPILKLQYTEPDTPPSSTTVDIELGSVLRMSNLKIPQGATITEARLVVTAEENNSQPMKAAIAFENVDSSEALKDLPGNLSLRWGRATSSVQWNETAPWQAGTQYQSPDLKSALQTVVDRAGWCGGNPLSVLIKGEGSRKISSFDGSSGSSAKLRVSFDSSNLGAGQGCVLRNFVTSVQKGSHDARERSGNVRSNLSRIKIGGDEVGMKFANIELPRNADIQQAFLRIVPSDNDGSTTNVSIKVEDTLAPASYQNSTFRTISRRNYLGDVAWPMPKFQKNVAVDSTDIKSLIQPMVNRAGWVSGQSSIALLVEGGSQNKLMYPREVSATKAPRLIVTAKVYAGDSTVPGLTVRDKLIEIVDGLDSIAYTPIRASLLEAANYMLGRDVDAGLARHFSNNRKSKGNYWNARISHPESYVGGAVINPAGCDETKLGSTACQNRRITGAARYQSPIPEGENDGQCQRTDAIVLLSDGAASMNTWDDNDKFTSLTGDSSCDDTDDRRACAVELARYLNEEKNIKTYTIAYGNDVGCTSPTTSSDKSKTLLYDIGEAGTDDDVEGCKEAVSQDDLVSAFSSVIDDVIEETTSFTAPALAVNTFNRLFHRDQVYLSMFEPRLGPKWPGNVKRYGLCEVKDASYCKLGQIIDQGDSTDASVPKRPIADERGIIIDEANSWWENTADGKFVEQGGAGKEQLDLLGSTGRKVYVYHTDDDPSGKPSLDESTYRLSTLNGGISKADLGDASMSDTERSNLIRWIYGADIFDDDGDGRKNEPRWVHGDPLHSSPVVVTYGGTDAEPVSKLVYGGNDGAIRMVNTENGKEEWAFFPYETLKKQALYRPGNTKKVYGVDGEFTVWLKEVNLTGKNHGDGIIDPDNETVFMYGGMRRGGKAIYALDITPTDIQESSDKGRTDQIVPKYMWRIANEGANKTSGYSNLGQTWSKPKVARIKRYDGSSVVSSEVIIFGGGYDTKLDADPLLTDANNVLGNSVYIADAYTGEKYFEITGDSSVGSSVHRHPEMKYPIPSDIGLIDSNNDGYVDRLYFYDVRGQLFRVDLGSDLKKQTAIISDNSVVERLAVIADLSDPARSDQRMTFYEPDVVFVEDEEFSNIKDYALIINQTGNRTSPLGAGVQDRLYAIRDTVMTKLPDTNGNYIADSERAITDSSLIDMTSLTSETVDKTDFKESKGYYFNFPSDYKGISKGLTFFGQYLFNVYIPASANSSSSSESCDDSAAIGTSELYAMNLLSGDGTTSYVDSSFTDSSDKTKRGTGLNQVGMIGTPRGLFLKEGVSILDGTTGGEFSAGDRAFKTFWAETAKNQ